MIEQELTRNSEVILQIESLSGDGKTVARQDGMVFFVEGAVPGDTVRARIFKLQKKFSEARTLEVLTPSSLRVTPRCKHFGTCGGCKWQNLAYDAQLRFKHRQVVDAFTRIGGFENPNVLPVIGVDDPYYYRNKMEFTFSNSRWLTAEEMLRKDEIKQELALGLHVPQRWDKLVNVEECFLQSEMSAAIVNAVREIARGWNLTSYSTETQEGYLRHLVIREWKRTGETMVTLVTSNDWLEAMGKLTTLLLKHFPEITTIVNNMTSRKAMVAFGESEKTYYGPGFIREQLGEYTFHISANSFFQTNTLQAERLYETAKQFAQLQSGDVVYDLYSGTGTIAIYLSEAVERVVGIEVVESAILDAEKNAAINKISNCYFLQGDLKDRLTKDSGWLLEHPKPTVIVADPPRSGMHQKVVERMIALSPERIVYVSCNPSTQARDVKLFAEGEYRLEKIQPVDMFPHTDHIESVALLVR